MASCVRNIHTENYQTLLTDFQVTVKNVGDVFLEYSVCVCMFICIIVNTGQCHHPDYCLFVLTIGSLYICEVCHP